MPLPIAHSFAGYLIARFMHGAESARRAPGLLIGGLVVAANAPDFDFIPGILAGDPGRFHHGASHSLLAAAAFTLASMLVARLAGSTSPLRFGLLMGGGYLSHLLLDMLESWMDAHSGVVLLWPVLTERLLSPFPIFFGIRLDPEAGGFVSGLWSVHNFLAAAWELVVVGGIWGLMLMRARRLR